jgi:hypothetical protein
VLREHKGFRAFRAIKEIKGFREHRERKVLKEFKEFRVFKEFKVHREFKVFRVCKAFRVFKAYKEDREIKDLMVYLEELTTSLMILFHRPLVHINSLEQVRQQLVKPQSRSISLQISRMFKSILDG